MLHSVGVGVLSRALYGVPLVALFVVACAARAELAAAPAPRSEEISFRSGPVLLAGTLHLPAGPGRHPALVALHSASGGTRDFHAYAHLATELPGAGFAVLLFDRRGAGRSGGDAGSATFEDLAADALAAVSFLETRAEIDPARIGVWGVSQGGWLGPLAASHSKDVAFVVSVSGPGVSPARQMAYAAATALQVAHQTPEVVERALAVRSVVDDYYRGRVTREIAEQAVAGIRAEPWFGQVYLPGGGRLPDDPAHTKWFAEMDYDPLRAVERVHVPIAFFFAENDSWVPVEESIAAIQRATRSNPAVEIVRIAGADHLMETGVPDSGGPISATYVDQLLEWLRKTVAH